jgi:hypothetical protein
VSTTLVHNVRDGRCGWVGSWETEPLDITKLTALDIGRTVIYRDYGRAEAGTLTSWKARENIVFAKYSRGDTAAGAYPYDLVFGIRRADQHHPHAPSSEGPWT